MHATDSPGELAQRIRHVLSWRTKAQQLEAESRHRRDQADSSRQLAMVQFYAAHAHRAETVLERIRANARQVLEARAGRLQRVLARQGEMSQDDPQAARLDTEIAAIRGEIVLLNRSCSAKSPDDLGGFVDRPLDSYRSEPWLREPPALDWRQLASRYAALFAAVFVCTAVATWWYLQLGAQVRFDLVPTAGPLQFQLSIENTTRETAFVFVPAAYPFPSAAPNAYGVFLYAKGDTSGRFRQIPITHPAWRGDPLAVAENAGPVRIDPGLRSELGLDFSALYEDFPDLSAIRIVVETTWGWEIFRTDVPVSNPASAGASAGRLLPPSPDAYVALRGFAASTHAGRAVAPGAAA